MKESVGTRMGTIAPRQVERLPLDELLRIFEDSYFGCTLGGVAQLVEQGTFNP